MKLATCVNTRVSSAIDSSSSLRYRWKLLTRSWKPTRLARKRASTRLAGAEPIASWMNATRRDVTRRDAQMGCAIIRVITHGVDASAAAAVSAIRSQYVDPPLALCASLLLIFPLRFFSFYPAIEPSLCRSILSVRQNASISARGCQSTAALHLSLSLFILRLFFAARSLSVSLCVCHSIDSRLYMPPLRASSFPRRSPGDNERAFSSDYLLIIGRVKKKKKKETSKRGAEKRHLCINVSAIARLLRYLLNISVSWSLLRRCRVASWIASERVRLVTEVRIIDCKLWK